MVSTAVGVGSLTRDHTARLSRDVNPGRLAHPCALHLLSCLCKSRGSCPTPRKRIPGSRRPHHIHRPAWGPWEPPASPGRIQPAAPARGEPSCDYNVRVFSHVPVTCRASSQLPGWPAPLGLLQPNQISLSLQGPGALGPLSLYSPDPCLSVCL